MERMEAMSSQPAGKSRTPRVDSEGTELVAIGLARSIELESSALRELAARPSFYSRTPQQIQEEIAAILIQWSRIA